jgi:hypothetical protein
MNMSDIVWSPGVTLNDIEKAAIIKAFRFFGNNKTATAAALGISIRTLDNKLERYAEEAKQEEIKAAELENRIAAITEKNRKSLEHSITTNIFEANQVKPFTQVDAPKEARIRKK